MSSEEDTNDDQSASSSSSSSSSSSKWKWVVGIVVLVGVALLIYFLTRSKSDPSLQGGHESHTQTSVIHGSPDSDTKSTDAPATTTGGTGNDNSNSDDNGDGTSSGQSSSQTGADGGDTNNPSKTPGAPSTDGKHKPTTHQAKFTKSGKMTVPKGVTSIFVTLVGGGGAGGGGGSGGHAGAGWIPCYSSRISGKHTYENMVAGGGGSAGGAAGHGGGGSSGEYIERQEISVKEGDVVNVVIGSGGKASSTPAKTPAHTAKSGYPTTNCMTPPDIFKRGDNSYRADDGIDGVDGADGADGSQTYVVINGTTFAIAQGGKGGKKGTGGKRGQGGTTYQGASLATNLNDWGKGGSGTLNGGDAAPQAFSGKGGEAVSSTSVKGQDGVPIRIKNRAGSGGHMVSTTKESLSFLKPSIRNSASGKAGTGGDGLAVNGTTRYLDQYRSSGSTGIVNQPSRVFHSLNTQGIPSALKDDPPYSTAKGGVLSKYSAYGAGGDGGKGGLGASNHNYQNAEYDPAKAANYTLINQGVPEAGQVGKDGKDGYAIIEYNV